MKTVLILVTVCAIFAMSPLPACEEDTTCDKCAEASEYSWNPKNDHASPQLWRFYSIDDQITGAYAGRNYDQARKLANEYLELAQVYRCNWNYGNAIHDGNRILGLIALQEGDTDAAAAYLLKAGKSTGSPQLDTFGPELDLANELLKLGKKEEVLRYLRDIASFWEMDDGKIDDWTGEIEGGGQPELKRFAVNTGKWHMLVFWVSALWPILVTAIVLIASRKTIRRKWLFGLAAIITGYLTMIAVNWLSASMLQSVIGNVSEKGSDSLLMLSIFALIGSGYILPVIVIFVISRLFTVRAKAGGSG